MDNKEKLDNFLKICMDDATKRSENLISKHTEYTEKEYRTKSKAIKDQNTELTKKEIDNMKQEYNIFLSRESARLKSEYLAKRKDYEDMLLSEVYDMLEKYMSTSDYVAYIENKIKEARPLADGEPMTLIISDADYSIAREIAVRYNTAIRITKENIIGGCMILIPNRNILIDNTFKNKLDNIRKNFHFDKAIEEVKQDKHHAKV